MTPLRVQSRPCFPPNYRSSPLQVALAIFPVFGLILAGGLLRLWMPRSDGFWAGAERLTYHLFFPVLLFLNALRVETAAGTAATAVLVSVAVVAGMALSLMWVRKRLTTLSGAAMGSLLQGAIRPNTYIAMGLAAGLYGSAGEAQMALCVAAVVPTVNLFSVLGFGLWCQGGRPTLTLLLGELLRNPLIAACLLGLAANGLELSLPEAVQGLLSMLAQPALPLGLLTVGAALTRGGRPQNLPLVGLSAGLKQLLLPLAAWALGTVAGMDGMPLAVVVLYAAMPASPSSYILAARLGGDAPLMATMITAQTLAAFLLLPLLAVIAGGF